MGGSPLSRFRRTAALPPDLMARIAAIEKDLQIVMGRIDGASNTPLHTDERFLEIAGRVKRTRRTMLTKGRLWTIWEAIQNVAHLEGGAAEVGTYRGGTAFFIAATFAEVVGQAVPVEVIDTFEGHPQDKVSEHDSETHRNPSIFTDTSYEDVARYLAPFDTVTVHKGEFSRVAPQLPDRQYRLVHVDVDLYEPTLDCLRYFGPRLVPGGVLIVDDFGSPSCPGVDRAATEWFDENEGFGSWSPRTKQLVIVKHS